MNSYKKLLYITILSVVATHIDAKQSIDLTAHLNQQELLILATLAHKHKEIAHNFKDLAELLSQDKLQKSDIEKIIPQFTACKNVITEIQEHVERQLEKNQSEESQQNEDKSIRNLGDLLRAKIRAHEQRKYDRKIQMHQIAKERSMAKQQQNSLHNHN